MLLLIFMLTINVKNKYVVLRNNHRILKNLNKNISKIKNIYFQLF